MPDPDYRNESATGNGESATLGKSSFGTGVFSEFTESEEQYFEGVARLGEKFGIGTVSSFEGVMQPVTLDGNVFYAGATPAPNEKNCAVSDAPSPIVSVEECSDGVYLTWRTDPALRAPTISTASTQTLGTVRIADAIFETPNGEEITVNKDYFGNQYAKRACSGAFELSDAMEHTLRVWEF